jgi:hypothetical protein
MSATRAKRTDETVARIRALWEEAMVVLPPEDATSAEKALGLQRDFQFNLAKAMRAGYESFQAASSMHDVNLHDPIGMVRAGFHSMLAAWSIMASLVEEISPITYVTGVMLSKHGNGLHQEALKKAVEEFLATPNATRFAWQLGMTEALAKRAAEATGQAAWLDAALRDLDERGYLRRDGDNLIFQSRNFRIRWNELL